MKSGFNGRFAFAAAILAGAWALAQNAPVRQQGVVSKVDAAANELILKTDSGDIDVKLQAKSSVRRVAPGETSLANAAAIALSDVNPGDRVLAVGKTGDDPKTIAATLVVVMSQNDIAKKQAAERADWDKRGVIGLVTAVNPDSIVISVRSQTPGPPKSMTITPEAKAVIKRYAPDSIKFSDAKPSTLAEIKVGDQVRALGNKSEDGAKMSAEEIVSGSFREIAATIVSIDAAEHIMQVKDLATKKAVTVKLGADAKLKKLPPQMAQMLAARNRPAEDGGRAPAAAEGRGGRGSGGGRGAGGDLTQLLDRVPNVTLADLKPGDAVIVLSSVGAQPDQLNAITMLAGVEPILTRPGTRQMELGSWSLGGGIGEGEP
ncbi:MAG TPA: hypothetical protein VKX39_05145 [Bryobacteraceae bacterium]|jgi:hypothetical protein|nr:hypothetical protein [Bryobacteraceae bacterium]